MVKLSAKAVATPVTGDHVAGIDSVTDDVNLYLISVLLGLYDSLSATLTNKTFDANGTGNSLSNVEDADIAAAAAIAYSKLAALTDGNLLVGNGSNVAVSVNPSGDVDISNAGVFSIVSDVIIDADVKSDAAIAGSKLQAAGLTNSGAVELATTAEIETGTDSTRPWASDQFVASDRNIRFVEFVLVAAATDVTATTSIGGDFRVPYTGTIIQDDNNLHYFCAYNSTAGVTGTMVVDVHLDGTTIMTTNKLDIETGEKTTADATTQPDLTTTAVTAGQILTFDVDTIHTTAAKGLIVRIPIRMT